MSLQVIHIPGSSLGTTVELRELTMDGFLAAQEAIKDVADDNTMETSMQYLTHMLFIDGQPVTRAQLGQFPMSGVMPLLNKMNVLFGTAEDNAGEG